MTKNSADSGFHMGDTQDFNRVYRDYFAPLCFFAKKMLVHQEQDIVNMLFVRLWNNKVSFATDNHCRNYLYKAIYNACMDEINARQHSKTRENLFAKAQGDEETSVEEVVIETEYWAEIYRELTKLPKTYSSIIELSYIDGLKNHEIAQKMNLSLQTIKNKKAKAIKMLRISLLKRVLIPISTFFSYFFI